jgi:predicted  nucleic acid-binding Zn-ribbon protein
VRTKKKKKPTPKEDLIESLMNDVQELSNQETLHKNAASALFSNNEYSDAVEGSDYSGEEEASDYSGDSKISLDPEGEASDSDRGGATDLWQAIRKSPAAPPKIEKNTTAKKSENEEGLKVPKERPQSFEAPPVNVALEEEMQAVVIEEDPQDDKTMNLSEAQIADIPPTPMPKSSAPASAVPKSETYLDHEKTVAVAGFANRQPLAAADVAPKVSFGSIRGSLNANGSVYAASDATLAQSESLRLAQRRILDLEKEVEKYRFENDELASAGDVIRERAENMAARVSALEVEKQESIDTLQNEMMILKGTHQYKEAELVRARLKIEELEGRLKSDFKKIRVRERELENRLELVKAEKSALLRAKDENILDLKRKIDHLQSELDNYRVKVLELNKTIEVNQEQFKRTVRALRLALSNLEVKEESAVPFKKAD